MGEPYRCGSRDLHFHQDLILRKQFHSVIPAGEIQILGSESDVPVKRQPKLRILRIPECQTVIRQKQFGDQFIVMPEPLDFLKDLRIGDLRLFSAPELFHGFSNAAHYTPFVNDPVKFLFDLHEHGPGLRRNSVASDAKLFLIQRLLHGMPDQFIIRCIIIDIADCALRIVIRNDMRLQCPTKPVILFRV